MLTRRRLPSLLYCTRTERVEVTDTVSAKPIVYRICLKYDEKMIK
jgi:hypothetical protein